MTTLTHRTSGQRVAGALRQGPYLSTVPTLAILASPVDPVVSYEGWLEEDRKAMGMGEGLDRYSPELSSQEVLCSPL